jgi:hypothetical protein
MFFHPIGIECGCVVCYDFDEAPKARQNFCLQKLDDEDVDSLLRGDHFYPFRKLVGGREYPFVLHRGWWIYFPYEIQTPLHEM